MGLEPRPALIDLGTAALIPTPGPRSIGFDDGWNSRSERNVARGAVEILTDGAVASVEDLNKAVADFARGETWSSLQPVVFRLLGQYSFGLGVVYGIGENVVTSVVELLLLVKTLLLADLYDRSQQPIFSAASLNPVALFQRLMAEASMRTFRGVLEEAHRERDALIEELRYAMTHIGEVLGTIKNSYVAKWNRFETLVQNRTLGSQFEAGRIFGEVLIEVVAVIGGGTAAVRAAGKIPRLAKLARLKIPAKSTGRVLPAAESASTREMAATPSQMRPAPMADAVPEKPTSAGAGPEVAGSIRNVNPLGGTTNCVNCSIATDATLGGRPASALASGPTPISVLEATYGRQFARVTGPSAIETELLNAGPGARGIILDHAGPDRSATSSTVSIRPALCVSSTARPEP